MNEPFAAVLIGLLFSLSAGVRVTLPLLALNLLVLEHLVALPANLAWLGAQPTLIVLVVAAVAETVIHFIPVAGTWLKAAATPLAFVAGTLLMAVPLSGHNPIYQWTLAAFLGGGTATLTHLGVTSARVATAPVNAASVGIFGLVWNVGEMLVSLVLAALGLLVIVAGWTLGAAVLLALLACGLLLGARALDFVSPARRAPS